MMRVRDKTHTHTYARNERECRVHIYCHREPVAPSSHHVIRVCACVCAVFAQSTARAHDCECAHVVHWFLCVCKNQGVTDPLHGRTPAHTQRGSVSQRFAEHEHGSHRLHRGINDGVCVHHYRMNRTTKPTAWPAERCTASTPLVQLQTVRCCCDCEYGAKPGHCETPPHTTPARRTRAPANKNTHTQTHPYTRAHL